MTPPQIVLGTPPGADSTFGAANFALPEDAIEVAPGNVIVADTENGFIKRVASGRVTVIAGNGKRPDSESGSPDSSTKAISPLLLHPASGGYISFSARGGGFDLHRDDGADKYLGRSYMLGGKVVEVSFAKFSADHDGRIIVLDGSGDRNQFVSVSEAGVEAYPTPPELAGLSIAGFDFCGADLVVSHVLASGAVEFLKFDSAGMTTLFVEQRPYSNGIKCIGENDFLYGARWELKRFSHWAKWVVAGGFVHIAQVRKGIDGYIVTDSDDETITRVNVDGTKSVLAMPGSQSLSSGVVKMQAVGSTILAMTSNGGLIRFDTATAKTTVLLANDGSGEWDKYLGGHHFTSTRAFAYDPEKQRLYIGSNHGIFLLDVAAGRFGLFAGSEDTYGSANGPVKDARFAVIRDLFLDQGTLYVADAWNDKIRAINLDTALVTDALGSGKNEAVDANAQRCGSELAYNLNRPTSIASLEGRIVAADFYSHDLIAKERGQACLFAGTPKPSLDQYGGGNADGAPGTALFSGPSSISSAFGGVLVADMWNSAVRYVDRRGNASTIFADPVAANMVSGAVAIGNFVYFAGADGTIKRFAVSVLE